MRTNSLHIESSSWNSTATSVTISSTTMKNKCQSFPFAESPDTAATGAVAKPVDFTEVNEEGAREFFGAHKWPVGLQDTFIANCKIILMRFIIVDNSGSMIRNDGHRLVTEKSTKK
jgi:hypothetical protein